MINSFRKTRLNVGAVTLLTAVILFIVSSLIIIFAANYGVMQQKSIANVDRNNQAFEAAEAGMEFGINYLRENASTILANPVTGYIVSFSNASTTNVALANGSTFSITYTNPTAYNYNLIQITSTGTNTDGTSTRIISQQVYRGTLLANPGTTPLVTQGAVNMSGSSHIWNTANNQTITAGGGVSLSGASSTTTASGGSNPLLTGPDIQQNNGAIGSMSQDAFVGSYFGEGNTASSLAGKTELYYNNSTDTNYSSDLAGKTGTSIYINQTSGTATINGNTTIGSAAAPVLLIINGSFSLSGNVAIYGFVFIIGTSGITSSTGTVSITGGIASTSTINMSGSSDLVYNAAVLSNLQNLPSLTYYAKVPGTWKDY